MNQRAILSAAVASALFVAGCNNPQEAGSTPGAKPSTPPAASVSKAPAPKAEDIVATVNGKAITKDAVKSMKSEIERQRGAHGVPDDKIIDELISREVLRQEAETKNLAQDPAYAARIESMMRIVLSQIDAENFIKTAEVSDEELKKEYDSRIGAMKFTEFRARHILVETEATAKDIIAKLQKGAKFEDLAKKLSKDPGSKDHGGELGWFNPQQMVPPFAAAVAVLKNGETTQTPVQSQFGWHVIQREESREQQPPAFDQVKDQIKSFLQTQKLQQHMTDLKANAKIEKTAQPEPPKPAEAAPTPPAAPAAPADAKPAQAAPAAVPVPAPASAPAAAPKEHPAVHPAPEAPKK